MPEAIYKKEQVKEQVFAFIQGFIVSNHGYAPSERQVADACPLANAHQHGAKSAINALIEDGVLYRHRSGKQRNIGLSGYVLVERERLDRLEALFLDAHGLAVEGA